MIVRPHCPRGHESASRGDDRVGPRPTANLSCKQRYSRGDCMEGPQAQNLERNDAKANRSSCFCSLTYPTDMYSRITKRILYSRLWFSTYLFRLLKHADVLVDVSAVGLTRNAARCQLLFQPVLTVDWFPDDFVYHKILLH